MFKKISLFFTGLYLSLNSALAVDPTDATAIDGMVDGVLDNATGIFNTVVTIVIAVVALGILITFAKRVKKG